MSAKGFYQTSAPVGADYVDQIVITIALPRGSGELAARIKTGMVFVLSACGIQNAGHLEPINALKHQDKKEGTAA